jgi:hypothetical protein
LNKQWHELQRLESPENDSVFFNASLDPNRELKRHCASCSKHVVDISRFDDRQVGALLQVDPAVCVHASRNSEHVHFDGAVVEQEMRRSIYSCTENAVGVPVVHTARTVHAINAAAKEGYWPLLKSVEPSPQIKQKVLVSQRSDGTITIDGDYRARPGANAYWYNPYRSPLPFAAYLIPQGLQPGARVYLVDLIEDIEGEIWNQGDSYRRVSAYAVWDGVDLNVEQEKPRGFIG